MGVFLAKKKAALMKSKSKSKINAKTKSKLPILKTSDLPVTQLMLTAVHKQIKASISSLEKKQDARFSQMDSKFDLVLSEIHRMTVLMEEQNSRNKFVLDGYDSIYQRQDSLEARFDTHEKNIEDLILMRNEVKEN